MNAPTALTALAFPVATWQISGDRLRYLAWINPQRTPPRINSGRRARPELAPRQALHLVQCRNGAGP